MMSAIGVMARLWVQESLLLCPLKFQLGEAFQFDWSEESLMIGYYNMKTAVDKVTKRNGRDVNARFFAMTAHYLFEPDW
jgi:hypothetical protein